MARSRRARREWSDGLPPELLRLVLLHLPCLADRVFFAAVCPAWRSAARGLAPPRQLPWLLLPCPNASSFFSLQSSSKRRLYLPEDVQDARLCGSHGGGWVTVAAHPWGGHATVNLLSGKRVPLPNRLKLRLCEYSLLLRSVVFSAAPTSEGSLAAAHISSATNLAFWRPGVDMHWTACLDVVDGLEDIIYHKSEVHQGFHVLTSKEDVMVYTSRSNDGPLEMSCNFYRVKKRAGYYGDQYKPLSLSVTRYLVESRGKLLMVLRHHSGRRARGTLRFRIFEMKLVIAPDGLSKASWVELDELSGRVLFLGRGCSRAFEVSQLDAVREGSIYYLDDTRFDISTVLDNGRDFSSADMGMNMYKMLKTRSRVRNFPRRFTSESSPPIWYVPELIDAMAFS